MLFASLFRRRPGVLAIALLVALAVRPVSAASEARPDVQPPPARDALQHELDALRDAPADDAQAKQLKDLYASAVQALDDVAAQRAEQARIEQLATDAPARNASIESELQDLQHARSPLASVQGAGIARLGRLLAEEKTHLADLRAQETELDAALAALLARVDGSRSELKALAEPGSALVMPVVRPGDTSPLARARLAEWQAHQELRSATRARLEAESRTLPVRIGLLRAQLKLATVQRELAERSVEELLGVENLQRISQASKLRDELAARIAAMATTVPELQELARETAALAEEHVGIVTRVESGSGEVSAAQQTLDELKGNYESTRAQLEIAALNDALGPVLVEHYRKLAEFEHPDRKLSGLSSLLSESRLREFQLSQLQHDAPALRERIEQAVAAAALPDAHARRQASLEADALQADRDRLLGALGHVYGEATAQIVELDDIYTGQEAIARKFRALLDRNLVWIRSHAPLSAIDLLHWPADTVRLLVAQDWRDFGREVVRSVLSRPVIASFAMLALLLVVHQQARLRARLALLGLRTNGWAAYRFRMTLEALLIQLLLALPVPLLALLGGWLLQGMANASALARGTGLALRDIGLLGYFYLFLLESFGAEGLARQHLRWRTARVQAVRKWLWRGLWVLLPLTFFSIVLGSLAGSDASQAPRITALLGSAVLFVLTALTARAGRGMFTAAFYSRVHPLLGRAADALVILLLLVQPLVLVLDFNGYHFTAQALQYRAFLSIVVLVLTKLVIDTGMLGLALAARHSMAALDQEAASADTAVASEAEPEIDFQAMNASAVALLYVFVIGAATLIMIALWSQFVTALSILDTVQMWSYHTTIDGKDVLASVSLFGLIGALLVLVLSFVAAKGLPAFLGLVLYGFITRKGVLFAIQTILSYVVAIVGVVIALQMLGFGWAKLQWMAAGLSVGLGFGLQEIFANFFAGLIMLFERPVRIGDVVTIGEFSGTIQRIQMRATTMTDFDNREIIVPNKMFVTERLINWTLSSPVVRINFDVGVSYDADPRIVRDTLLELLGEDPRILHEPEPVVTFREFGPSSLNFRCAAHVVDLNLRAAVQNDLHMRIAEVFRARGIEIAFPQMDLHVRSIDAGARTAFGGGEA